jgi:hypothetical protein
MALMFPWLQTWIEPLYSMCQDCFKLFNISYTIRPRPGKTDAIWRNLYLYYHRRSKYSTKHIMDIRQVVKPYTGHY